MSKSDFAKVAQLIHKDIENFTDDFLRWLILYSAPESEFVKTIDGSEDEQQQFLSDLRKAAKTPSTSRSMAVIQKLAPKTRIPSAEEAFDKILDEKFKGWPSSGGRSGGVPYGFFLHDLKKKLKEEVKKRSEKHDRA